MRALLLLLVGTSGPLVLLAEGQADRPSPRLIAHRGLLRHAPENTLAAFAACLDLNLGFELDVRRSKDGELVLVHDDDLKRTTSGKGKVADHTFADLRRLDAGSWFDPAFAGERVPTLEQAFALVKTRGKPSTLVAVDLKIDDGKVEVDVVRLAKKYGVLDRIVCIGTTIDSLAVRKRLREADPATPTAVLAQTAADLPKALAEKEAQWAYLRFVPTPAEVGRARTAGKKILVVGKAVMGREPANWAKTREAGAAALLTDFPLDCRRSWHGKK